MYVFINYKRLFTKQNLSTDPMSGLLISSLYQSGLSRYTIKGKLKIFSILSVLGQVLKSLLIVKVNSVSKVIFFGFSTS